MRISLATTLELQIRTNSHLGHPMTDGPSCLICFALARQRHNVKPTAITIGCVVEALVINKQGEEAWQLVQDWNDMIYRKGTGAGGVKEFLLQFASVVNLMLLVKWHHANISCA